MMLYWKMRRSLLRRSWRLEVDLDSEAGWTARTTCRFKGTRQEAKEKLIDLVEAVYGSTVHRDTLDAVRERIYES